MENAGVWDRLIRFVFALIFFVVGSLYVDGTPRLILYVFSLAMVISSTSGFCLLYKLLDIDTLKNKKKI